MTTAVKRPTIKELVLRTEFKDEITLLKLHNYLFKENNEMYHYLDSRKELEDFIVNRTDIAEKAYRASVFANDPSPEEVRNEALFIGIENSYSEYVESMLDEVPEFKKKIESSVKRNLTLEKLTWGALPIFYELINTPYVESMDELDKAIIQYLEGEAKIYTF
jgi:exoribonuclease II